jgi:hypothetical protein
MEQMELIPMPEALNENFELATHSFTCFSKKNEKTTHFSDCFKLLTAVITQGDEYPANLKQLVAGMNSLIVHHVITPAPPDALMRIVAAHNQKVKNHQEQKQEQHQEQQQ